MQLEKVTPHPNCQYCQTQTNVWTCIDRAVCISLANRDDRKAIADQELHRTGLCQITEFYRPQRDPHGFVRGCWQSHVNVAEWALTQPELQKVLVLEDDFDMDPNVTAEQVAQEVTEALQKLPPTKWNRLSLGHYAWFSLPYAAGVTRANALLTHAQIWSRSGLQWMATHQHDGNTGGIMQVDGFISLRLSHSYAISPQRFGQKDIGSDNTVTPNANLALATLQTSDWTISGAWLIGTIVLGLIFIWILWKFVKFAVWSAVGIGLLVFVFPFVLTWILALTDVY